MTGEPAILSGLGSSTGAGRGTGTSLGGGDTEGMVAGCSSSSSSSEDSDDEDEDEEDEEEEDEELDELPLSESEVLSFSPSESAYREHLEDESLPSSSPGNPEGAIRRGARWEDPSLGQTMGSFNDSLLRTCKTLCARCWEALASRSWVCTQFVHSVMNFSGKGWGCMAKGSPGFCPEGEAKEGTPVKEMLKLRKTWRSLPSTHRAKWGC